MPANLKVLLLMCVIGFCHGALSQSQVSELLARQRRNIFSSIFRVPEHILETAEHIVEPAGKLCQSIISTALPGVDGGFQAGKLLGSIGQGSSIGGGGSSGQGAQVQGYGGSGGSSGGGGDSSGQSTSNNQNNANVQIETSAGSEVSSSNHGDSSGSGSSSGSGEATAVATSTASASASSRKKRNIFQEIFQLPREAISAAQGFVGHAFPGAIGHIAAVPLNVAESALKGVVGVVADPHSAFPAHVFPPGFPPSNLPTAVQASAASPSCGQH